MAPGKLVFRQMILDYVSDDPACSSALSRVARKDRVSATAREIEQGRLLESTRVRIRGWIPVGSRVVIDRRRRTSLVQRSFANRDTGEFPAFDFFVQPGYAQLTVFQPLQQGYGLILRLEIGMPRLQTVYD